MDEIAKTMTLSAVAVRNFLENEGFGLTSFARLIGTGDDALWFFVHTKIVPFFIPPICICGNQKILRIRQQPNNENYEWICQNIPNQRRCTSRKSFTSGTWLENSKMDFRTILDLMLHWFFKTPVSSAAGQLAVSKECAINYYNKCRSVCYDTMSRQDICIGGEGLTVEIDESHLWKRKYHQGRILANGDVWVFGGICRETKEAFIELVPDRKGETIWPIIKRRIAPGTTIMSDRAKIYDDLHRQDRGGFQHYQVNHSYNFVDPNDPTIYTNTVERLWGLLKKSINGYTDLDENLLYYISEFLYRKQYFSCQSDRDHRYRGKQFRQFLAHVKEIYPGPYSNQE